MIPFAMNAFDAARQWLQANAVGACTVLVITACGAIRYHYKHRVRRTFDVQVENHGSIFTFRPMNEKASQWIQDNVDAPLFFGSSLCVHHRYAPGLAGGMAKDGLRL